MSDSIKLNYHNRDGEILGSEEFESVADLLRAWPTAEAESETEYVDWVGGRR